MRRLPDWVISKADTKRSQQVVSFVAFQVKVVKLFNKCIDRLGSKSLTRSTHQQQQHSLNGLFPGQPR